MKHTVRQAVILAAGRGARLNNVAGDVPKCLARVGDMTLLERQIGSLRRAGIRKVLVIVGYRAGLVRRACAGLADCLENERFFETNSLYSLWLAREYLQGGCVIINGDVLLHPRLLVDLLASPYPDALLVSYSSPLFPLGAEEMKVTLCGGRVTDITKDMDGRMADGENVGVLRFGASGAPLLIEKLEMLVHQGALRDWAPRAFREFALQRPLYAVPTRGLPWIEIDYPADYCRAIDEILPLIEMNRARADESLVVAMASD